MAEGVDAEGEAFVNALSFGYVGIKTRDLKQCVRFHGEVFGLRKIPACSLPCASITRRFSGFVRKEAARCQKRFEPRLESSLRLGRDGLPVLTALYERKRWRVVHVDGDYWPEEGGLLSREYCA